MPANAVLYAAFEAWPGLKGAQTHIRHCLRALGRFSEPVELICLGRGERRIDPETGAQLLPVSLREPNFLRRTELFGHAVHRLANAMADRPPRVIQFRDIWSGLPLLESAIGRKSPCIFEVNGLPSMELASHYPPLAENRPLLSRIRRMELHCLQKADQIITVSRVNRDCLLELGADPAKITVLANPADPPVPEGVLLPEPFTHLLAEGREILLYVGTLAPWQGIDILLDALRHLRHRQKLHLVLVTPAMKWLKKVEQSCDELGISRQVTILIDLPHQQVQAMFGKATISLAPLTRGVRNELQGCSPFKIVESMACGLPVVASDLPVVRELIEHGVDGWLVATGSSRSLAGGVETLLDNPELRIRLATAAARRVRQDFSISLFEERICEIYKEVISAEKGR